jgi:hypothetical protein
MNISHKTQNVITRLKVKNIFVYLSVKYKSMVLYRRVKGKAIPVTGREGPQVYETLRLSHFLDRRLRDGGKVVSLTHRPPFSP